MSVKNMLKLFWFIFLKLKWNTVAFQINKINKFKSKTRKFSTLSFKTKSESLDSRQQQQQQRFVRLKRNKNHYDLETCTLTLENKNRTKINLHGIVHFGSKEYYENLNSQKETTLYELIVPRQCLSFTDESGLKAKLSTTIMPAPNDIQTAAQLGLVCQVNVLNFTQPHWYCADLTKEELVTHYPSTQWSIPGAELVSAFIRPTSPRQSSSIQLFSNLFLSGSFITLFLRFLLWAAPAPDISILLLDCSALSSPRPAVGISPISNPVISHVLNGNFQAARSLLFANVLVSSHLQPLSEQLLARNDQAMTVLDYTLEEEEKEKNVTLIYGVHHCPDLYSRLKNNYQVVSQTWEKAFSIPISANTSPPLAFLFLGYLVLSAFDWFSMIQSVALAFEGNVNFIEFGFDILAYFLRHLVVYLTLVKFLVQWDELSYS